MNEFVGKVCSFCKTPIEVSDEVVLCPACEIPHHKDCWEENRGCTTFGCSEQHYEPLGMNISDVCARCGMLLGDDQDFCPKCGTRKGVPAANICGNCGAMLQEDQVFCSKCGWKVGLGEHINESRDENMVYPNKRKTSPVVALILSLLLVGLGQMINGQLIKGLFMLVASLLVGAMVGEAAILIGIPIWILSGIDAYMCADKLKKGQPIGRFSFF